MSRKLVLLLIFVLSMLLVGSASALTVTGTITVGGVGLQNVSVVASGGAQGATAAGISTATGAYTCNHSATTTGNMLVLTPAKVGYVFSPAGSTFNLTSNASGKNFTATAVSTYVISGSTGNVDGVTLSGLPYGAVVTSGGGSYSATVNTGWSGTVTPTLTGYTFNPVNIVFSSVTSNQTNQNYTPVCTTISGTVGNLEGVTMSGLPGTVVTLAGGAYSGTITPGWSGVVTPVKAGYTFDPASKTYTSVSGSITGENYTPTQITAYTISGSVGTLSGVTMGGLGVVTAIDGSYSAVVNGGWSGVVTPSKTGYTFSPASSTYDSVTSDQTGQNYTPTINTYTISGSVSTIDGVTMSGLPGNPVTSGGGFYSVTVEYGWSGVVTPTKAGGYAFSPATKTYTIVAANQTLAYTTKDKTFTNGSGIDNSFAQANNWNPAGAPATDARVFIFGDTAGAAGLLVNSTVNIGRGGGDPGNYVYVGNGGEQTALMTVDTGASVLSGAVTVGKLSSGIVNFNGGAWNTPADFRNWIVGEGGSGVLNMNGGTLTTGVFIINSTGQVNVTGGKIQPYNGMTVKSGAQINIEAGTIEEYTQELSPFKISTGGVIDINEGKLILLGDKRTKVADVNGVAEYISEGKITCPGNKGIFCDYNVTTSGKTTVWAQSTDPTAAVILIPSDGAKYLPITTQLSWQAGHYANSHDVYLGTTAADVDDAIDNSNGLQVLDDQAVTTASLTLAYNTTYYWRVDENHNSGTLKGQVWSFTTISQEEIPADSNLVGWWKFDDDGDSMAWDYTGRGNYGTLKNTTFVDGKIGKALNFVAASKANVDLPSAAFSTLNKQVTVSLWQNGSTLQPLNQSIFNGQNASNVRVLNSHLPYSSGTVYFDAGYSGTTYDRLTKPATADQYKGQWNHWAFTKNTTTGQMKVYYNGILWQSSTGMTKLMNGITKFKIGGDAVGTTTNYDGMIDDFRVYDRELTALEIEGLASAGSAYNLSPANNASTQTSVMLDWDSIAASPSYNVYLSSNLADVDNSTALVASGTQSNYQANGLNMDTTYWWAVDVNDNGTMYLADTIMSFKTMNAFQIAVANGHGPDHNSGDFDRDGKVRFEDVISMAALLNNRGQMIDNKQTIPGTSQYYNVLADTNGDGMIRFNDLVTVVGWINTHGTMVARKLTIMCPHTYGL